MRGTAPYPGGAARRSVSEDVGGRCAPGSPAGALGPVRPGIGHNAGEQRRSPARTLGKRGLRMIAAIYARKSTDQSGLTDEAKSVTRQVEHARAYASRKGWTVAEAYVFVDDGISGAEFEKRPGFLRLMDALQPRPPFRVLIMSEASRLGREGIQTNSELKGVVTADVRVWCYLDDRELTLSSTNDELLVTVNSVIDDMERERARQGTADAMLRKARAGHVTGGRVYGYDNREV